VTYRVQYFNPNDERWAESRDATVPGKYLSEAERLAEKRSTKSHFTYRVRDNGRTVSTWKGGKQVADKNIPKGSGELS
jgi:hypothetical protein